MPRTKKVAENAPNTVTHSVKSQSTAKEKKVIENYAKAENAIRKLRDVNKSTTGRTINSFNKDSLRSYLQNISSNEKNLRNLSRYLYYRSQVYFRLIYYNSNMFCLDARSVIPEYNVSEENDKEAMLKSYGDTLNALDKMSF